MCSALVIVLLLTLVSAEKTAGAAAIEHVVLLLMENRPFDMCARNILPSTPAAYPPPTAHMVRSLGVFHRKPKPSNCPTRRRSPARNFGPFVPGKGGSAQGRSRMEHRNQTRVPGVFISYHGACRRLALL